jgi:hypothetical protein
MVEEKTLKEKLLQFAVQVKEITKKPNYYEFVHKVLPMFFFKSSKYFKETFKSSEYPFELMVTGLYEVFAEDFKKFPPGVSWFGDVTEDIKAFVLEMPEPKRVTEPYFVAFVFQFEKGSLKPRYFVLEKSFQLFPDDPPAVLCEWTEEGVHNNYMWLRIESLTIKDFCEGIKKVIKEGER